MKNFRVPVILVVLSLLLVACGSQQAPIDGNIGPASGEQSITSNGNQESESSLNWLIGQTREDGQGSVTVEVTTEKINSVAGTIEFFVVMNTHSVELNMDLAALASLTTDTGVSVNGMAWDAPREGHHVEGILSFPASVNGASVLDGTTQLTLTIRDVDAAERVFSWQAQR